MKSALYQFLSFYNSLDCIFKLSEEVSSIFITSLRNDLFSLVGWLYGCTPFSRVSVIWRCPVHPSMLSWSFFNRYSAQYSFETTAFLPTEPLSKQQTAVREEEILSQWLSSILEKKYWPSRRSNQRPPILKTEPLLTDPWGSARHF